MHPKLNIFKLSILIGLITGLFLGFGFKLVEQLYKVRIYTLLLNVDFIPGFSQDTSELLEFTLHLITSIGIAFIFVTAVQRLGSPWLWGLFLGILAAFLYIPLSLLSLRVPTLHDSAAIIYWSIGHLMFGLLLGALGRLLIQRSPVNSPR